VNLKDLPRRWKVFAIIALVTIVADQATKWWARDLPVDRVSARSMLDKPCAVPDDLVSHQCVGRPVTVIDGFLEWRLSFNPGSAFGLFNSQGGARVFLSIVAVLAVVGMLWMLKKAREDQKALTWALGLVAGGAVGNLIDRVYYGVVTDFAAMTVPVIDYSWPVFNVADIALVVGVGLMFIDIQQEGKKGKKGKKKG
jgi:signal peptidase II